MAGPTLGAVAVLLGITISLSVSCLFLNVAIGASYGLMRCNQTRVAKNVDTQTSSWQENLYACMVATPRAAQILLQHPYWRSFLVSYAICLLVFAVVSLLIPFLVGHHS